MLPRPARFLSALLLAALAATAQAKNAPEPVPLDDQFKPEEQAAALLTAPDWRALKGVRRAAVPQFSVEFITTDSVSGETSSFGRSGSASATGVYRLGGVAEPDFQALAEAFHGEFLRQLQAGGIQVVPAAELAAAPTYRKLLAAGSPLPARGDSSVTVAPPGMAQYGMGRAQASTGKTGLFGALSAIGSVASAIGNVGENAELQKELGGATLLEVSLRVHFAQLVNHNKGFFGRMAQNAKVTGTLAPAVTQATLTVMTGPVVNVVTLTQPLAMDPVIFTELRKESATGGDVAAGLLRLAIGGSTSHSTQRFEAVADNAKYREIVGASLAKVGELFVARLKAER